jgi:uncharacterized protein YdbL (DUF1318 family)
MDTSWLLLVYTVPAEPSRKRAYVWREVKKLGAVYLRDGVCLLPQSPETLAAAETLARKVEEFEGQATVVSAAHLDQARAQDAVRQFQAARAEEYAEIAREAERLLEHIARETEHRDFSFAELEELEQDLGKLKRWYAQVQQRDHFPATAAPEAEDLLRRCEQGLATFMERAADPEVSTS